MLVLLARKSKTELVGTPILEKAVHADAKIAYHRGDTGGNNCKYGWMEKYATQPASSARGENVRVTKETMGKYPVRSFRALQK